MAVERDNLCNCELCMTIRRIYSAMAKVSEKKPRGRKKTNKKTQKQRLG